MSLHQFPCCCKVTSTCVLENTIIIENENLIKDDIDIYVGGSVSETSITGCNVGCHFS